MKTLLQRILLIAVAGCGALNTPHAEAQPSPTQSYTNTILPGWNLIANHLDNGGNTLNAVLPNVAEGSQVRKWDEGTQSFHVDSYDGLTGWIDDGGTPSITTLGPREAAFLFNPGPPYPLAFTGEPRTPAPPPALTRAALHYLSHQAKDRGRFHDLTGQPPEEGALFIRWNADTQDYETNRFTGDQWQPSEPVAEIGEGVVIWLPSGAPPRIVRLAGREFTPPEGVDPALVTAAIAAQMSGATNIHCLAQLPVMSAPPDWIPWANAGILYSAYLGESNWVASVALGADAAASLQSAASVLNATALTVLMPEDRAPATLRERILAPAPGGEPFKVTALFFPTADASAASNLVQAFIQPGVELPERVSLEAWVLRVAPGDPMATMAFQELLAHDGLHFVSERLENLPLMDTVRQHTGVDAVHQIVPASAFSPLPIYAGYTGRGVRLSNWEGFDANHDDFSNHDAAGNKTTPRWIGCAASFNIPHGTMTAGIMLGNGWRSAAGGGMPWQWRGVAPEAIFDCLGSGEDAANLSYVQTYGDYNAGSANLDSDIRGDGWVNNFHPIVYAVGNQGITPQYGPPVYNGSSPLSVNNLPPNLWQRAYYSIYAPNKNSIVVTKVRKSDLGWDEGSVGPTFDGRLKPDISAPVGMRTTSYFNSNGYSVEGGSSAAAPVVTGSLALLLEQMKTRFGLVLGNHSPSPFWSAPGTGVPLPSTLKALVLHTAEDLASIPQVTDPSNPDTGGPTVYHKGPDLVTGYGTLNVGEAVRLVEAEARQSGQQYIREREFTTFGLHSYTFVVPTGQTDPLRVTLVWDDAPGSPLPAVPVPRLLNDLDLELVAPGGVVHYPWTIDQPYLPLTLTPANYPDVKEPEPITAASIKPARRDKPDHLNNVEQVCVEVPQAGTWTVKVRAVSLPTCKPQKYSLITGMPPTPAQDLACGKVVFVSDRPTGSGSQQIFVKQVGASGPPSKITSSSFFPHHPTWSPNGLYIAYIDRTVIVGGGGGQVDALFIVTETGVLKLFLPAPAIGATDLGYPEWSPDGKKIVIMTHPNNWGARNLKMIEFNTAYNFNGGHAITTIVPSGAGAGDATFSPDGKLLYYNAESGGPGTVWRVPATGGTPTPVYGNNAQIIRGYAVSVSPDGRRLIYNSELWKDDPITYLDEELLQADLLTGVVTALTHEPGNQYGKFAKGGSGEYVMQANATVSSKTDIFLATHNARVKLDIADPSNLYNDGDVCWWKPSKADYVHADWDTAVCLDDTYTDVKVTICNQSCAPHTYSYSVAGLPGVGGVPGATCNVDGPTQFQFLNANPISVPAMGCVTVKVRMFRPVGLTADKLVACFRVTANNLDTGASFSANGSLQDVRITCPVRVPDCCPTELVIGPGRPLTFAVRNVTGTNLTFNYRVVPVNADMVSPVRFLSLNGLLPGEPVSGVITDLTPGATTHITVDARFLGLETGILDVLLQVDAGSPGEFRTLMSQSLQSLPGANGTVVLAPPQFTGDALSLRWSGVGMGQSVAVEASSDLTNWTLLAIPPADANQVELPLNPEQPARFFRLRRSSEP